MSAEGTAQMSLEDSIATLLSALPKPVQAFVLGPDRPRIAIELSKKYNLHVDQAGVLEQAFMQMLLGVSSPQEFVDSLTKAGIPPDSVRGLAQDVNEQVFVPLRKAEQAGEPVARPAPPAPPVVPRASATLPGSTEPVPVTPPRPTMPAPTLIQPAAQPQMYMPAPPQQMYGYIPQQMPPQMMYAPPYAMPAPYGAPVYMWPQQPPQAWPQAQAMPAQAPQPVAAPAYTPSTPAPAPQQKAPVQPTQSSPAPQPKATTLNPSTPLQKTYTADPYREAFSE